MHTRTTSRRLVLALAMAASAAAMASCGLDKQSAPALAGPSEFATSVTLTASPDILPRDGASQSVITATARDAANNPIAGLPLTLGLIPGNGGVLSASQVVTDASGRATFAYVAPSVNTPVDQVTVTATPTSSNFANAVARNVEIGLAGPGFASPSFTVNPVSPQRFAVVTFDASGTTLDGSECNGNCSYSWNFGGENTATGRVVTYRFQQQQTYLVTLAVTTTGGVTTETRQSVVVQAGTAPTATFTVSPTGPVVGQQVFMNAADSTAANGATIVEYQWDFGNGSTATGASVSTSFAAKGTFVVRLTVRDSNGITATKTQTVSVTDPS
jgi:PKD repeat protein